MRTHIAVIGWINIILGLFSALVGLVAAFGIALPGFAFLPALPFLGLLGFVIFLFAASGVLLGFGLLNYSNWARILGIVLSVLHLFSAHTMGFSTLFGIYSLVILFSPEATRLFESGGRSSY